MLVNLEKLTNWVIDFLSRLPEKDMYISEQSRRYWLFRENMKKLEKK